MLMDINLQFSNAQAITSTAPSTGVLDLATGLMLTGSTYVTNPSINYGPNATYFGEDLGIGDSQGQPTIVGSALSAFTSGGGSATLQVALQGAPDNGGGTISGLTFTTFMETGAIPQASLQTSVSPFQSNRMFAFALPRRQTGIALPRFLRLDYIVASGPFTGGTLDADVTLQTDSGWQIGQYPSGYHVSA